MLHVHIFLGSLYLGVSACTKKSLLIFTSGLNNKLSFRSAEFTTDYRALHSRQESRAPLLGSGQREPGKDPARSSAQICSLRLQVAHQRAPGLCKPSGSRILCRKSFFVKSSGGTLIQEKTNYPQSTARAPRAAPSGCQCYRQV